MSVFESAAGKMCPITGKTCAEQKCAWWCTFGDDCAVPIAAGILADSEICRTIFDGGKDGGKE